MFKSKNEPVMVKQPEPSVNSFTSNTNTNITLTKVAGSLGRSVAAWNWMLPIVANDYVEIKNIIIEILEKNFGSIDKMYKKFIINNL